jgi:hypothetical protein
VKRRLVVLVFLLVLVGIGVVAESVATDPYVRARYHLRRAAPAEVVLFENGDYVLQGHAQAFAHSPMAAGLLGSDLLPLARDEATRDQEACFRVILFETVPQRRYAVARVWDPTGKRLDEMTFVPAEVLSVFVRSLDSRSVLLRTVTLKSLPLDPRILAAVVARLGAVADRNEEAATRRALLEWLTEFSLANQRLVSQEGRLSLDGFTQIDEAWESTGPLHPPPRFPVPSERVLARRLTAWMERHRSALPLQVR